MAEEKNQGTATMDAAGENTVEVTFLPEGKTVSFEASRARDGSNAGLLRVMMLPDGKVVSACPQNC